ncbi:MAG: TlpA disulfide reductase family protein [bacterium]|nr:TlpA disulfide reductase family protein [bacterium]
MWWILSALICAEAPNFSIPSIEGKTVVLDSLVQNGYVVVDFWGTWCKPCIKSLDTFNKMCDEFKKVTFLGINENPAYSRNEVKSVVKLHKWKFLILCDENKKVTEALQVKAIPHAFIIGPGRKIVYDHVGYKKGDEQLIRKKLIELLKSCPIDSAVTPTSSETK